MPNPRSLYTAVIKSTTLLALGAIGNHYWGKPSEKSMHDAFRKLLPEEQVWFTLNNVSPEVRDAIAVRACDDVTMYGKVKFDRVTEVAKTGRARASITASSYTWATGGALSVPIYHDKYINQTFVQMVIETERQRPGQPLVATFPGGYIGFNPLGEEYDSLRKDKDACEVGLLKGDKTVYENGFSMTPNPIYPDIKIQSTVEREYTEEVGGQLPDLYPIDVRFESNTGFRKPSGFTFFYRSDAVDMRPSTPPNPAEIQKTIWVPTHKISSDGSFVLNNEAYKINPREQEPLKLALQNHAKTHGSIVPGGILSMTVNEEQMFMSQRGHP